MTELETNPYESPQYLEASINANSKLTFRVIARTLALGILAGMFLGVLTNSINGAIYPSHFARFRANFGVNSSWLASILQGGMEGAGYGLGNAVVLLGATAILPCQFRLADKLSRIVSIASALVIGFWLLGGCAGLSVTPVRSYLPMSWTWDFLTGYWSSNKRWVLWSMGGSIWGSPLATVIAYAWVYRERPPEPAP